jgi:hypothetical protein
MKKFLLSTVAMAFYAAAVAQVHQSYSFAVGNTNGVTISWDAYSENLEIQGCYLYKRVKYNQPEVLISPELIVSDDSTYSFTDTGEFDSIFPPVYSIHCITADSVYIISNIYAFQIIEIEPVGNNTLLFEVQAWNNTQCCRSVLLFIQGIFLGNLPYNGSLSFYYNFGDFRSPSGDIWFLFEDHDWWLNYSELTVYYSYIENLLLTSGFPELRQVQPKLIVSPNPATSGTWLQLPENMPLTAMQIELYSPTGRLLYKAKPISHFHKIDVAHLPRGLYLVRVWDGERWYAEKLVMQ